jgi:carbamoyl-phosphate synthase small subunit
VIVHELANISSNFRRQMNLNDYLIAHKIPGLQNVNTRLLTRTIRSIGVMKAMICDDISNIKNKIKQIKKFQIIHPVPIVSNANIRKFGDGKYKIALVDYGLKQNILRTLLTFDVSVSVFPHDVDAKTILKSKPDGIVLSNGPGNPKDNKIAINTIKELYKQNIPILGICLGHQLLSLATGADTKKLKYGHRGPNHPVKNLKNNRVYISSQNHGYYIDESTINPKIAKVIYRNVNDRTVEGLKYIDKKILTVQFHPEACAGPQDTSFIFKDFIDTIKEVKKSK